MESTTEFCWNELADQDRFLVCYPAGISNAWHDCRADALERDPPSDDIGFFNALLDGSTITRYHYRNGREGSEVLYDEVIGGGHGWPSPTRFSPLRQLIVGKKSRDVVMGDEAWAFFQRHTVHPLAITVFQSDPLRWEGVAEATFHIDTTTNLSAWTPLGSVPGQPQAMAYPLHPTSPSRHYRVHQTRPSGRLSAATGSRSAT